MLLEELLDRLERVEHRQGYSVARCPAHEDVKASLSVTESAEGRILLKCFAGCSYEDIISALQIESKELSGKGGGSREEEIVYQYVYEDGSPAYEVVRFPGKDFRQRHYENGEVVWTMKGVRKVLYHLPDVLQAAAAGKVVFVCAGEKDADAVREAGEIATCNVGGEGKNKWHDDYSRCLIGAKVVVIVDKDETGRKHAKAVRDSLRKFGVDVWLMQAKKGKDAHDHYVKHGYATKDLVKVREERMSTVVTADQMADNALRAMSSTKDSKAFYPNPWGFEEPEFVPGRLYIIGGWTGAGKSALVAQLYRHLSEAKLRVGLITNEMTEADFRNRILCHRGFKMKELEKPWDMSEPDKARLVKEIEIFRSWNSEIVFDTDADCKSAVGYLEEGAYDMLIFDHLHNIQAVRGGEESVINKEIGGFASMALDFDVPVFVVGQLRNPVPGMGSPRPTIRDFKGSGGIGQNAAMALGIWRDGNQSSAELIVLKNRYGRSDYTEYMTFKASEYRFEKVGETVGNPERSQVWQ